MSDQTHEFTTLDDIYIWKAFLDARKEEFGSARIVRRKAEEFQKKMYVFFLLYIEEENATARPSLKGKIVLSEHIKKSITARYNKFQKKIYDSYLLDSEEESTSSKGEVLSAHTKESIIARYNDVIGPEVFRYLIVMKTTTMKRNKPNQAFFKECRERFEKKHRRPFLLTIRKEDVDLISRWVNEIQFNDPDVFLVELSDAASRFPRKCLFCSGDTATD
mmetsp:Transcript_24843/g.36755  ORF Transcript_24843/g.36755 Transcript_24843/m.36755 type:complete len:219 (-) Transcript_24843:27-683(-)